jgi:SpoVK/Ycf46/Vps4 family AAA+-type ATPase
MLNNRIKRFKSHTDINHYNHFLLELDKKQLTQDKQLNQDKKMVTNLEEKKQLKEKCLDEFCKGFNKGFETTFTQLLKNENKNPSIEELNEIVKNICLSFEKCQLGNPLFTGLSPLDILSSYIEKQKEVHLTNKINDNKDNKKNVSFHKDKINIMEEINNVGDILKLIEKYPLDKHIEYNINMEALHKIKKPLIDLNNMIGMKQLKENIVDQIIFYIQGLHTLKTDIAGNDFMHTVIYGPPGTGKTEIAKIIGSIFSKMGVLNKGTFKKVTRADLIAGYLGQTALKTRDVIKECLGGVLFIDEAYALGNDEKRDSFSKECIDTLCEALSDHKDNLMVIIAGYENDLNNCFFNYNQGLNSRFTWRFKTDEYNARDLYNIFLKKVNDGGWKLAEKSNIEIKWFEKNKKYFPFYGRDIETLFAKTKIAHSRRVFCLDSSVKKYITIQDLDKGLEMYLKNDEIKKKEEPIHSIYV